MSTASTRTLVFIDNQGGFEPQANIANANHIEPDGQTTINPLHIEAVPEHLRDRLDADPFEMATKSARTLIAGTMRNQGTDISDFAHTLDDLIRQTYRDAEIYPDDFDSHARQSPDMRDLIRIGETMLEKPKKFTTSSSEWEAEELRDEMAKLMRRLNGFSKTGKHSNLVGQTEVRIEPGVVNYLDLRKIDMQDSSTSSVQLFQMLRNVYETFKIAPGEKIAIFDEAHNFLEDLQMAQWLATASRQLRNYNGALWLVSQSPLDFAASEGDSSEIAKLKDKIREQCSIVDMFQQNTLDEQIAREKFNMNSKHRKFVTDEAVAGEAGLGHTTAITDFSDRSGWYKYEIKRGAVMTAANAYKRSEHGDWDAYMETVYDAQEAYDPDGNEDPFEHMDLYLERAGYGNGTIVSRAAAEEGGGAF